MNPFEFALMLAALLFGGHSALHRWDVRKTRREMLRRACRAPEHVAQAWVEGEEGRASGRLWLQLAGGKPQMVADGRLGCVEAAIRLRGAGIKLSVCAAQTDPVHAAVTHRLPVQHGARRLPSVSPLT